MIELEKICFDSEGFRVLDNISLSIKKKERFILIGPGGHGKTVLLKIIAGILEPTQGNVIINSKYQHSLSMVFQQNALFDSMTTFDNAAFPLLESTDFKKNEINDAVNKILDEVGLRDAGNLYPHELSGGMQKRAAIARALIIKPDILLLDDPSAGLDPVTSHEITEMILDVQRKYDTTILMVTTNIRQALDTGSNFGVLINGKLKLYDSGEFLMSSKEPDVNQFVHGLKTGPLSVLYGEHTE